MMDYQIQECISSAIRNYFANSKYDSPQSNPIAQLLNDVDQIRINVQTLFYNAHNNPMTGKYRAYKGVKITLNLYDVAYILPPDDNNTVHLVVAGEKMSLLYDSATAANSEFTAIQNLLLSLT